MRRLTTVALLLVMGGCSSGRTSPPAGPLAGGGDGSGTSFEKTEAGMPYTVGGILLCTAEEPLVIDKVEAADVSGEVSLQKVGLRSSPPSAGGIPVGAGALPDVMGPVAGYEVTQSCDDGNVATVSELGLQVARNGTQTARIGHLRISYHAGDQEYETRYPFTVVMCVAGTDCPQG